MRREQNIVSRQRSAVLRKVTRRVQLGVERVLAIVEGGKAMSVPDHELDEPSDAEWCEIHEEYRVCRGCKAEALERAEERESQP